VLDGESGELLESLAAEDGARGIVGRIENQDAGAGRNLCGDFLEIRLKFVFLFKAERNGPGTEATGKRGINRKAGVGIENFSARLDERHHGE
jgi:hypothetical protein